MISLGKRNHHGRQKFRRVLVPSGLRAFWVGCAWRQVSRNPCGPRRKI